MKFAKTLSRSELLPVLVLTSAAVVSLSLDPSAGGVALSPIAEAGVVGGTLCSFGGGVAVGLGIGGLFGCVVCGVGSVILGTGVWLLC